MVIQPAAQPGHREDQREDQYVSNRRCADRGEGQMMDPSEKQGLQGVADVEAEPGDESTAHHAAEEELL